MCVSSSRNERMISEVVIPPLPITRKFYKCDKVFHLDHLLTLYDDHTSGGLVLIRGELVEMYNFRDLDVNLLIKLLFGDKKLKKLVEVVLVVLIGRNKHRFMIILVILQHESKKIILIILMENHVLKF
jgi:hypothetical protein